MFKIASWNVNSIKMRIDQVIKWLIDFQIDVLALQETKIIDENFPAHLFREIGYEVVFSGQKSYNGMAIISRQSGQDVITDIPNLIDPQRRILAITYHGLRIINLYVPNGSEVGSDKYQYKLHWLDQMASYIELQKKLFSQVIVLGDFNIAPEDRDVHDPAVWLGKVMVSEAERAAFSRLLQLGFSDSYRLFEENPNEFSWWDYRAAAFRRNMGLRIDHILLSSELTPYCTCSKIDKNARRAEKPSDHAPVIVELNK